MGGKWGGTIVAQSGDLIEDLIPDLRAAKRAAEDGVRGLLAPAFAALATPTPTELPHPTTEEGA